MSSQMLGLITGIFFGFLLQKGRVLRFERQIGFLRLQDMTVLKFMLSAIVVGMIGLHWLEAQEVIAFSRKSMNVGGVVLGGILFGAGWAVMGYCPGTSLGALGEGRWHAVFAVLGMLIGAALYAELYPAFKGSVLAWKDFGKIGLPEVLGTCPAVVIVIYAAVVVALCACIERRKR